jgi:hypothetical protein
VKLFDSDDPALNATMFIMACAVGLMLFAISAAVAIPVLAVIGIAKGMHWYYNRPVPTDVLAKQTQTLANRAAFPSIDTFLDAITARLLDHYQADNLPSYPIFHKMVVIAGTLYEAEDLANPLPPLPPENTIEEGRYRDHLLEQTKKAADPAKTLDTFHRAIGESFIALSKVLPPIARSTGNEDTEQYTVSFIDVTPNVGQLIWDMIAPFFAREAVELGLFKGLREEYTRNYLNTDRKAIEPYQHKGTPREIVRAYLSDTPLHQLFEVSIPLDFDDKTRMEHFHLCAGSGWGKTQLIQSLILRDLQKEDPPALIIIDSQQDMLDKIQRLALFNDKLAQRLVVIEPIYTPALNMFDTSGDRLKKYTRDIREQVEASVIELYNYIFGAIASELTSKQNVAFSFVVRLMLATPHATIHTLLELMEDKTVDRWTPTINTRLDLTAQAFFKNQFFDKSFSQTRQQIARRLYSVLSVPSFDRMFSTTENKLDMFECIQSKNIVLVNTAKALLKTDACALFGRYMIAQTMAAAFERAATKHRPPAFLIIDEAADYFDESLESLLSQARKHQLGVLFAHQAMSQMSQSLQGIVAGNTSIKVAGGVSDKDARALAPDMRTTPDFLTNLQKSERSTQFAAYIRNKTARAVRIDVPFGALEKEPRMTDAEHVALIARNKARYSPSDAPPAPTEPFVNFTPRPPEMEPWRLDSADRKPAPPTPANDDTHTTPSKDY